MEGPLPWQREAPTQTVDPGRQNAGVQVHTSFTKFGLTLSYRTDSCLTQIYTVAFDIRPSPLSRNLFN